MFAFRTSAGLLESVAFDELEAALPALRWNNLQEHAAVGQRFLDMRQMFVNLFFRYADRAGDILGCGLSFEKDINYLLPYGLIHYAIRGQGLCCAKPVFVLMKFHFNKYLPISIQIELLASC